MNLPEGKIIGLDQVMKLPPRVKFLDQKAVAECRKQLADGSPVEFLPVNVWETYLPEYNGVFAPNNKYAVRAFKIALFGILKSGEKITVILDGIQPFLEARVPAGTTPETFKARLGEICTLKGYKVKNMTEAKGATCKEFQDDAHFIQMYFSSTKQRADCIRGLEDQGIETYHNDLTGYYKVVTRDYQSSVTNWVTLMNYKAKKHPWFKTQNTIFVKPQDWKPYSGDILKDELLKKDRTIVMGQDIETDDPHLTTDVPQPESPTADMFSMGVNFSFLDCGLMPQDGEPGTPSYSYAKPEGYLAMYTITTDACKARPNRVTILVKDEKEEIQAFGMLGRLMQMDYIVDFNGSNYDWHWILERARQYGLLQFLERQFSIADLDAYAKFEAKKWYCPTDIKKYWWNKKYVFKLSADLSVDGRQLALPGYQCIDLMPQLRSIHNNPERYGLNVFLKKYRLGTKVDMPYQRMFAIHRLIKAITKLVPINIPARNQILEWMGLSQIWEQLLIESSHVHEYCLVDAAKCQDLLQQSVLVRDRREVGYLSYTSMEDSVNRANGMKVRNMTIAEANQRGLRMSNIPPKVIETGKYPGAYVFPPQKGVKKPRISIAEIMKEAKDNNPEWRKWLIMQPDQIDKLFDFIYENGVWWDLLTEAKQDFLKVTFPPFVVEWFKMDHHYPIGGLDFSSLYPSLIMAYNFSPEMMVHTLTRALELKKMGFRIHPVKFKFNGRDIVGWSIRHDYSGEGPLDPLRSRFGLFPTILKKLFDARDALKKELKPYAKRKEQIELLKGEDFAKAADEYSRIMFMYNYYNSKQKALKVFMNTFYGEAGNALSPLRVLALAGGVTTAGQYNIQTVAKEVTKLGWRIYYGDSVTMDTPILLRGADKKIMIRTPAQISTWNGTQGEKLVSDDWNNLEVWSLGGWTPIKCVVKHKTTKKIYRVNTHSGLVDVTEDHSLITNEGKEIKPQDCKIGGTQLMHTYPTNEVKDLIIWPYEKPQNAEQHKALIWGFFFGDGSCGRYECPSGIKHSWALNNQDQKVLDILLESLKFAHPDHEFKQLDTLESSGVYKIVPQGDIKAIVAEYRPEFYDHEKLKKVPDRIINGDPVIKQFFMMGYYMADGARSNGKVSGTSNTILTCKGKIGSAGLFYLMSQLGYNCSICWRKDKLDIFKITCTKSFQRKHTDILKKLDILREAKEEEVVDLVTESHMFQAGIGSQIVHNTDSLYIAAPKISYFDLDKIYYSGRMKKIEYMEKRVVTAFKLIEEVKGFVNKMLKADSGTAFLKMAYEEILDPTALFAKKKYIGIPHLEHFNADPKELFIRGIETVKKGVSKLLKELLEKLMWQMMDCNNHKDVMLLVIEAIKEVYTKEHEFADFIKTAKWKPKKKNVTVQTFAERMKLIGKCPEPLATFEYVMVRKYPYKYDIRGRKTELSVGERMEYADVARKDNLPIDLDYYMSANVCGQLARFVSPSPQFHIEAKGDDDYDEAEAKSMKAANAWVAQECSKYSKKYVSQGPLYQALFKKVNNGFQALGSEIGGSGEVLQLLWPDPKKVKSSKFLENNTMFDDLISKLDKLADKEAKSEAKALSKKYISSSLDTLLGYKRVWMQILKDREYYLQVEKAKTLGHLRNIMSSLQSLISKRDQVMQKCITKVKTAWNLDQQLETDHKAMVQSLNDKALYQVMKSEMALLWTADDVRKMDKIYTLVRTFIEQSKQVTRTKEVLNIINYEIAFKNGDLKPVMKSKKLKRDAQKFAEEHFPI